MACTVAVESVISDHYAQQASQLGESEAELKQTIEQFRAEELEHHDIGMQHDAESAPFYTLLSEAIKAGCRASIWLAKRV
jgi:ubiquinone biosynthesis monooxygenase Coq7